MGKAASKCASCCQGKCEQSYSNRDKCDDPDNCTCTCQEHAFETVLNGARNVILGGNLVGFGVFAMVGGLSGVVLSGFLVSAGMKLITQPFTKKMNGERITPEAFFEESAIAGATGALTAPIAFGSEKFLFLTNITSGISTPGAVGVIKLLGRAIAGAIIGGTCSIFQEVTNGQCNWSNVAKDAACGALFGAAVHVFRPNNVLEFAAKGIARSVAKVATDAAIIAAIEAFHQAIVDGKVDGKKLGLNTFFGTFSSVLGEIMNNLIYKAYGGKDAMRESQVLDSLESEDREFASKAKEKMQQLPPETIEKEIQLAKDFPAAKKEKEMKLKEFDAKLKAKKKELDDIKISKEMKRDERIQLQNDRQKLKDEITKLTNDKQHINKKPVPESNMIGDQYIHAMHHDKKRYGQFSADLSATEGMDGRGLKRVVMDCKDNGAGGYETPIVGATLRHDIERDVPTYNNAPEMNLGVTSAIKQSVGHCNDGEEKKNK